jgi:SAM-dependent methyltransferase
MTPPDPTDPTDPVVASVAAYTAHVDDYIATHGPKMVDPVQRFASSLPVPARILDAGCGPGRDLARFTAYGHHAHGVDLNAAFVARANASAPTTQGDLRDIGTLFPAGTFDGIWACASLVHLTGPETEGVLRQFARLLRPGGRLYACVKAVGVTGWLDEPDGRRWYTVWEPAAFVAAIAGAGFVVDRVDHGPFTEVWATSTLARTSGVGNSGIRN